MPSLCFNLLLKVKIDFQLQKYNKIKFIDLLQYPELSFLWVFITCAACVYLYVHTSLHKLVTRSQKDFQKVTLNTISDNDHIRMILCPRSVNPIQIDFPLIQKPQGPIVIPYERKNNYKTPPPQRVKYPAEVDINKRW